MCHSCVIHGIDVIDLAPGNWQLPQFFFSRGFRRLSGGVQVRIQSVQGLGAPWIQPWIQQSALPRMHDLELLLGGFPKHVLTEK